MSDKPMVLRWRKSRASVLSDCIEVASSGDRILIRDSTDRPGPVLEFPDREWSAFIGRIAESLRPGFYGMLKAVDPFAQ
jgi:hypothetical protein